jgi:hypothetical protein
MSWDDDLQDWDVGVSSDEPFIETDTFTMMMRPEGLTERLAQSEPTRLLCWFVIREPRTQRGTILPIHPEKVIGRGRDASIRLEDPRMSRIHARFSLENDGFTVWDVGARNGVFVNDQRVEKSATLKENDEVKMGDTLFVVKLLD